MYWYILVASRYLGLFGDHIVPAVLHRYTQVLRRPDLLNSKGKQLVTTARLEAVWKRLSDRLATVVADTSMITMSTAYATHFHASFTLMARKTPTSGGKPVQTVQTMCKPKIDPKGDFP